MILTLITIALIMVGIILLIIDRHTWTDLTYGYTPCLFFGIIGLSISLFVILASHSGVALAIHNNNIQYESLCKRLDIAKSEYEDISKLSIVADVAEWDKEVAGYKYWVVSPWTNWFYAQEIADNLKYIPLE